MREDASRGMARWRDRVAMVTGATSGIGKAVAEHLLEAGMRVAVCGRNQDVLEQLRQAHGDRIDAVALDVRDEAAMLAWFDRLDAAWGGVDVLVNNAGLGHMASLIDGETEAFREMLDVNVLALTVATREAVGRMRRRGIDDGHVVHISSMSAHRVPQGGGMYAGTKFAVRALTEALRQELRELGSGIRVTSVSPGNVETSFHARLMRSEEAAREMYQELKVLEARDIADTVLWVVASPAHMEVHDILIRPTAQVS